MGPETVLCGVIASLLRGVGVDGCLGDSTCAFGSSVSLTEHVITPVPAQLTV